MFRSLAHVHQLYRGVLVGLSEKQPVNIYENECNNPLFGVITKGRNKLRETSDGWACTHTHFRGTHETFTHPICLRDQYPIPPVHMCSRSRHAPKRARTRGPEMLMDKEYAWIPQITTKEPPKHPSGKNIETDSSTQESGSLCPF